MVDDLFIILALQGDLSRLEIGKVPESMKAKHLIIIAIFNAALGVVYCLHIGNGRHIEVTQYSIDREGDRVQFRATATGLNYTIPLEYLETESGESGIFCG